MAFIVPDVHVRIPEPLKTGASLIKMKERRNYLILKVELAYAKGGASEETFKELDELSAKISHLETILREPLKIFGELGS